MSERNLDAIVLRQRPLGDNDRSLVLLSREEGKVEAIARGARKPGSRLAGAAEPMMQARITLAKGKRHDYVTQVQPIRAYRGMRENFDRMMLGLALVELYEALSEIGQEQAEAYLLLETSLQAIETHDEPLAAGLWAQVQWLAMSGFLPQFDQDVTSGSPVAENPAWFSAIAGGVVPAESLYAYPDACEVRYEVLVALAKLAELDAAPRHVRSGGECLQTLLRVWRAVTSRSLPACSTAVESVCTSL